MRLKFVVVLISVTSVQNMFLLQGEVSYHQKRLRGDLFFDFGRIPQWNCPIAGKPATHKRKKQKKNRRPPTPAPAPASDKPWFIPPIECYEPEDGVFFAQVGQGSLPALAPTCSNLVIFRLDQLAETMATQQSLVTSAGASPGTSTASSSPRSTW